MSVTALTLGSKGLSTHVLGTGDLLVSGYLTRWNEIDRQSEAFVRGSFTKSIPAFLAGHSPLCYAHKTSSVIGRVLSLVEDHIGVKMVARVSAQPLSSPLRWIYEAVKRGDIAGTSVGAIFERMGASITGVDIVECSLTASPVLGSTSVEVVSEGKALEWFAAGAGAGDQAAVVARMRAVARKADVAGDQRRVLAMARQAQWQCAVARAEHVAARGRLF